MFCTQSWLNIKKKMFYYPFLIHVFVRNINKNIFVFIFFWQVRSKKTYFVLLFSNMNARVLDGSQKSLFVPNILRKRLINGANMFKNHWFVFVFLHMCFSSSFYICHWICITRGSALPNANTLKQTLVLLSFCYSMFNKLKSH